MRYFPLHVGIVIALCTIFPAPASSAAEAAADPSLGPVHYKLPDGWKEAAQPDGRRMLVFPGAGGNNEAAIIIVLTDAPPGKPVNLQAAFDAMMNVLIQDRKVTEQTVIVPSRTGGGDDALAQNLAADDRTGNHLFLSLSMVDLKTQVVAFGLLTDSAERFNKHYPALNAFLGGLRFVEDKTASTAPSPAPGVAPEQQEIARKKAELQRQLAELEALEKAVQQRPPPAIVPPPATKPAVPAELLEDR